ncbi:MAG: hypothetical protein ACRCSX_07425, partial [Allorhizobium sp.]
PLFVVVPRRISRILCRDAQLWQAAKFRLAWKIGLCLHGLNFSQPDREMHCPGTPAATLKSPKIEIFSRNTNNIGS